MNSPFDNLFLNGDLKEVQVPIFHKYLEEHMKDNFYLKSEYTNFLKNKIFRLIQELDDFKSSFELRNEPLSEFNKSYIKSINDELKRLNKELFKMESLKYFLNKGFFYCDYMQNYYDNKFFKLINYTFDKWFTNKISGNAEEPVFEFIVNGNSLYHYLKTKEEYYS